MGIVTNIERLCTQTAVYWGTPVNDGYGGRTYADPVEISCRWEDREEAITMLGEDRKAIEYVTQSIVYTLQDVDKEGLLYLGDLTDLDSAEEENPETVSGAHKIKRFDKTPALGSTNDFIRKAYL